jgi:hypothetical protein
MLLSASTSSVSAANSYSIALLFPLFILSGVLINDRYEASGDYLNFLLNPNFLILMLFSVVLLEVQYHRIYYG